MNTQHNLQGPMQAAIHATNILAEQKKEAEQKSIKAPPAVVFRKDLLNNRVAFLADTQNREADTIQYWDGKKGSKPTEVSMQYYKSTKPIESQEEVTKFVQDFSKEFGTKELVVRQRLLKSSVLDRDSEGKVDKTEIEAWKQKLLSSLTKIIMEA
jgi:hypothetical protein